MEAKLSTGMASEQEWQLVRIIKRARQEIVGSMVCAGGMVFLSASMLVVLAISGFGSDFTPESMVVIYWFSLVVFALVAIFSLYVCIKSKVAARKAFKETCAVNSEYSLEFGGMVSHDTRRSSDESMEQMQELLARVT